MDFQPKSDSALDSLNDDEIIEYISSARGSGHQAAMRQGLGILAFRRRRMVWTKVAAKVGDNQDIEDIVQLVMMNAIEAKFKGDHMGEFVNLLNTAIHFRIADFYKSREKGPEFVDPGGDSPDDSDIFDTIPATDDHEAFSVTRDLVLQDLESLNPAHKLVVFYSLRGHSASEIAQMVNEKLDPDPPMSSDNVAQIESRFRARMKKALERRKRS